MTELSFQNAEEADKTLALAVNSSNFISYEVNRAFKERYKQIKKTLSKDVPPTLTANVVKDLKLKGASNSLIALHYGIREEAIREFMQLSGYTWRVATKSYERTNSLPARRFPEKDRSKVIVKTQRSFRVKLTAGAAAVLALKLHMENVDRDTWISNVILNSVTEEFQNLSNKIIQVKSKEI